MAIVRVDAGLGARVPREVEVDGWTVHMCLDQVGRRHGADFLDVVLDHVPGERWRLSDRAIVRLNGADVRTAEGLSTPVGLKDVLEVLPTAAAGHGIRGARKA